MKAEIISVGTELLLGEVVNTNASDIAKALKEIGISVYNIDTVGDNPKRLYEDIEKAYDRSDIIITTGGLGPTKDDLTKDIVADFLKVDMVLDENEVEKLKNYFKNRKDELNEGNMTQAYFPKGYEILDNPNGTASGCVINKDNKIIIVMPGPPREMKPMLKNYVIPYLSKLSSKYFASKTINVIGIGESKMEEMIMELIKHQTNPTIAPYFKDKSLTLRVMASDDDKKTAENMLLPTIEKIKSILNDNIYAYGDDLAIEDVVCKYLMDNNLTVSTVESCTGGMLSSRIINISGISKCFKSGYVTYSNESKIQLGVSEDTLQKYGAVSEQTAIEMATACAKKSGSDIAISTTGVAGPDGGSEEKPVGLVYIGLYINGQTYCKKLNIVGNRQRIRRIATSNALDFVRRTLKMPIYEIN
ncbi:competence/damage-inducible protein CinA domain [Peptoanaerobacter stomatis]|uniref:Putative competence-damage inducible protein n=1 Tax=Peptoanaerobacter stomatis TaxID=796937 RepID=J6HJN5_9FIRM|nr:competence/damage-inducible protein A [Peptoanaerobacter stomatis]EHL14830.1 competence/damage-inducible protein CinA domain [Peptoanaerobacter stomatis]EJU22843.1 competence/damage-inducible protein CinA [Peptoanaerobacter stomatis]NWO25520.1 competence/damage-inducible protein A [Peptostreptococcaceae bacterium oral taxon 081]